MEHNSIDELEAPKKAHIEDHNGEGDTETVPESIGELSLDGIIEQDNVPDAKPLARNTSDRSAKGASKCKLAEAIVNFGPLKMKTAKATANDNYRGKESWPIMEQLVRPTFERDKFKRAKMVAAVHRIRHLVDTTSLDVLGLAVHVVGKDAPVDFDLQRNDDGKVVYEAGLTLDREPQTHNAKNGETNAKRHDGAVRTARGGRVDNSGYDPNRDDPAVFRVIDASDELEEIIISTGPLWLSLYAAACHNKTSTEIGEATGAKHAQASGVGTAILRMALEAAIGTIERYAQGMDEASYLQWLRKQPPGTPVSARRHRRALEAISSPKAA